MKVIKEWREYILSMPAFLPETMVFLCNLNILEVQVYTFVFFLLKSRVGS